MLTITHDLSHALATCPRAIVMNAGRVVADGSTTELLADEQLLATNRLELPHGLGPRVSARCDIETGTVPRDCGGGTMTPQVHTIKGVLRQEEVTTGTGEVDVVCGRQGAACEVLYGGPTANCSPKR